MNKTKDIMLKIKQIIDAILPPLKKIKWLPGWVLAVLGIIATVIGALIVFL